MNNNLIIFFKLSSSSRAKSYSSLKVSLFYTNIKLRKFILSDIFKILARLKFKKINALIFIHNVKIKSFN